MGAGERTTSVRDNCAWIVLLVTCCHDIVEQPLGETEAGCRVKTGQWTGGLFLQCPSVLSSGTQVWWAFMYK